MHVGVVINYYDTWFLELPVNRRPDWRTDRKPCLSYGWLHLSSVTRIYFYFLFLTDCSLMSVLIQCCCLCFDNWDTSQILSLWQEQGNHNFDTACFPVKVNVNWVGLNTQDTNTKEAWTAQRLKRGTKFVIGVQDSPVRRCGARHFNHDLSATFQRRNCSTERWTSARSARISKGRTCFLYFLLW